MDRLFRFRDVFAIPYVFVNSFVLAIWTTLPSMKKAISSCKLIFIEFPKKREKNDDKGMRIGG